MEKNLMNRRSFIRKCVLLAPALVFGPKLIENRAYARSYTRKEVEKIQPKIKGEIALLLAQGERVRLKMKKEGGSSRAWNFFDNLDSYIKDTFEDVLISLKHFEENEKHEIFDIENAEGVRVVGQKTMQIESLIFEFVNNERAKRGVRKLVYDEKLSEISRGHAEDMAKNFFYSHINLKRQDVTDRARAAGYDTKRTVNGLVFYGVGENIANAKTGKVFGRGYVEDTQANVSWEFTRTWMESRGHRENLLNSIYSKTGIGVAKEYSLYYEVFDGLFIENGSNYKGVQNFW
ncbi:MAG: CAP domain-containing protein [Candidatus Micrarchaeota archaeon]